jgi:hypothetical protein
MQVFCGRVLQALVLRISEAAVELGCAMQPIGELVEDGGVIQVNDKQLPAPLRIRLKYADAMQP